MIHPLRSCMRDLYRRLTNSTRDQPGRPVDLDGPTQWRPALPVQLGEYRAVRLAARNGAGTLYRSHRVGFNNSPGPRPRSGMRVAL
jgi:hypothetical protein